MRASLVDVDASDGVHGWGARLRLTVRALRLPFLTASALPYAVGVAHAPATGSGLATGLVFAAVLLTHLSANLINDVADRDADAEDPTYYGFFGGSKLIQDGTVSARRYRVGAVACAGGALGCVGIAAYGSGMYGILPAYLLILLMGWGYSHGPLGFARRGWGEAVVALLFGPVTVVGGYLMRAGAWPADGEVWWLGGGLGLLTAAILLACEVPDAPDDAAAGKRTLVVRVGARWGHGVYAGVTLLAFGFFVWVFAGDEASLLPWLGVGLLPAGVAWWGLRTAYTNKMRLVQSAKGAILTQTWAGLVLAGAAWLDTGF